ncbi:MAG: hypothetical protein ACREOO_11770 [bacterium]
MIRPHGLAILPAAALALLFVSCVQGLRFRDVIDLPPPQDVQAFRHHDSITVKWQKPGALARDDLTGYFLYFAPRSLAAISLAQLPRPIEIPPQLTLFTFAVADSSPVFIHMRTRSGRKHVSLPSMPELIVPPVVSR